MKISKVILALLLLLLMQFSCNKQSTIDQEEIIPETLKVLQLDFDKNIVGDYTNENLTNDIGQVEWFIIDGRANIEDDTEHKKVLRVTYPEGTVGPQQSGIQFVKSIPNADEYYLDYFLKFNEGFDFALGGKLPGLTSGGSTFTGGVKPENGEGWSMRYMWISGGEIIVYFYYLDMISSFGDAIKLNINFETGKWYRITQHIKLNDTDKFNGVMEVWVDGKKVINNTEVRYRIAPLGKIDSFYFSTFHGGSTAEWAPINDSHMYYDEFTVTNTKPDNLN